MDSINIIKNRSEKSEAALYKSQYKNWRITQRESDAKYLILYKDFDIHLKDISSGALKLLLYYGFNGKNETGHSWHSIDTISKYFGVSSRSVNTWNKELEDRGLIARSNSNEKSKTTYLLPFCTNIIFINDKTKNSYVKKDMNDKSFIKVYGEKTAAFHFFQWRKNPDDDTKYDDPYNTLVIVYSKKYKSYVQNTAFIYPISTNEYNDYIDTKKFHDEIYIFDSNLDIPELDLRIQGIAVNSKFNIRTYQVLKDLVTQLMNPLVDLDEFYKINLIHKEETVDEKD